LAYNLRVSVIFYKDYADMTKIGRPRIHSTDEEFLYARNEASKAWYHRKKHDINWRLERAARERNRRLSKKDDPEWKAKESLRHKRELQDPVYAEHRRQYLVDYRKRPDIAEKNKDHWEYNKRKYAVYFMLKNAKARAKNSNLDFDLEEADITVPQKCPVLGIDIAHYQTKENRDHSVTLDRIDPKKGYTKKNTRIISYLANRIKSDCTDPIVFRKIADYIEENLGKNNDEIS